MGQHVLNPRSLGILSTHPKVRRRPAAVQLPDEAKREKGTSSPSLSYSWCHMARTSCMSLSAITEKELPLQTTGTFSTRSSIARARPMRRPNLGTIVQHSSYLRKRTLARDDCDLIVAADLLGSPDSVCCTKSTGNAREEMADLLNLGIVVVLSIKGGTKRLDNVLSCILDDNDGLHSGIVS